jgi:hypothetical protein
VPAQAQELLGASDGPCLAVTAQGEMAVLGSGLWLKVLDIVDPAAPALLGELLLPGVVRDVALQDSLAYVAADRAGLLIVDLHNPSSPVLRGSCVVAAALGVVVEGDRACLAGPHAISSVDIQDPDQPHLTGSVEQFLLVPGMDLDGGLAFVPDMMYGMFISDLSGAGAPVEVAHLATGTYGSGVAVADGRAYLKTSAGLQVYDLSVADSPQLLGSQSVGGTGRVALRDALAFVATANSLLALDVSEPSAPALVNTLPLSASGSLAALGLTNSRALLADSREGLRLIQAVDPADLAQLSLTPIGAFASEVVMAEGVAYVQGPLALRSYDLAQPTHPPQLGLMAAGGAAEGLALDGHLLGMARGSSGLALVDVTDPADLHYLGSLVLPGEVKGVELAEVWPTCQPGSMACGSRMCHSPPRPSRWATWAMAPAACGM